MSTGVFEGVETKDSIRCHSLGGQCDRFWSIGSLTGMKFNLSLPCYPGISDECTPPSSLMYILGINLGLSCL